MFTYILPTSIVKNYLYIFNLPYWGHFESGVIEIKMPLFDHPKKSKNKHVTGLVKILLSYKADYLLLYESNDK